MWIFVVFSNSAFEIVACAITEGGDRRHIGAAYFPTQANLQDLWWNHETNAKADNEKYIVSF